MPVTELSFEAIIVFLIIGVALLLFVSETIPTDVTAIGIIATLASIEPVFGIDIGVPPQDALLGFANPATITIVAMFMLSAGIQRTGVVQRLGVLLARWARGDDRRALAATVITTGPLAGFVNNTPVVSVFIPMIRDLAKKNGTSPSKLMLPLSYAAILGGTLTLIGTSTNILAGDFTRVLIEDRAGIGMFEFTALGIVILVVGIVYLLTIGYRLTPERIPPTIDPLTEFELQEMLTQVRVREDSPIVGKSISEIEADTAAPISFLQVRRNGEVFAAPFTDVTVEPWDALIIHGGQENVESFRDSNDLRTLDRVEISSETFEDAPTDMVLTSAVVPDGSQYVGETVDETRLEEFQQTTILAIRRKGTLFRTDLGSVRIRAGDMVLARMAERSIDYFAEGDDLFVLDERAYNQYLERKAEEKKPLHPKTPISVGVLGGVVTVAALDIVPIVIAALAGVFTMIVTGCLSAADAYDSVSWNIIFLLAGVIPLGLALESTGGAAFLAELIISAELVLPVVGIMLLFYIVTGLIANIITPVAAVVLMIPIAVDAAAQLEATPFSFLLIVMFASATSLMTPVGYQTNLMVYGPGGYRFTDFVRVGGPLQLLLAVVTTTGVVLLWGT